MNPLNTQPRLKLFFDLIAMWLTAADRALFPVCGLVHFNPKITGVIFPPIDIHGCC
jgi:hypothetical protein